MTGVQTCALPISVKKGPFVQPRLLARVEEMNKRNERRVLKTWSRASVIYPAFIGHTIAVYNGRTALSARPSPLVNDFFAFEQSLRNGVYVSVGDVNGDGYGDLVFGAGPGGVNAQSGAIGHTGMAISPQLFIQSSGQGIALARWDTGYYKDRLAFGKSVLP